MENASHLYVGFEANKDVKWKMILVRHAVIGPQIHCILGEHLPSRIVLSPPPSTLKFLLFMPFSPWIIT